MLALTGGQISAIRMAGQIAPPIFFSPLAEKRKRAVHGPKEKRRWGTNLTARVKLCPKVRGLA